MAVRMKLNVVDSPKPWFSGGLRFTCTECGNCCTGGPGYVWISGVEIARLAQHLGLSTRQVRIKYCRKIDGRTSLNEVRSAEGNYDCVFLREEKVAAPAESGTNAPVVRRTCAIYEARPLQCRTWPFWPENVKSPTAWRHAAQRCEGMNYGARIFTRKKIESLRDAEDWPVNPPTS